MKEIFWTIFCNLFCYTCFKDLGKEDFLPDSEEKNLSMNKGLEDFVRISGLNKRRDELFSKDFRSLKVKW